MMRRFFRGLAYLLGGMAVLFIGLPVLAYLIYFSPLGPWAAIDIALPEKLGKITFSRIHSSPMFAEYERRVEVRLSDGRRLSSDLMTNYGGRTKMFFHWQPAHDGLGPFLMLEDHIGATWVNLKDLCIRSSNKSDMVGSFLNICPVERMPVSVEWSYLGRVQAGEKELEFIAGAHWPPKGVEVGWYLGAPIPLPEERWTFEAIIRPPARRGLAGGDKWLIMRRAGGPPLTVPITGDEFGGNKASLRWYPASGSRGPYLRVGTDGGTLVDLRQRLIFKIHSAQTRMAFSDTPKYGTAMGMLPFPRADGGYVTYFEKDDRLTVKDEFGEYQPLPPVPDFFARILPMELGTLYWGMFDFKYIPTKQR